MSAKQQQPAVVRAVNAMIRALGGATVKLRLASGAEEGLERELGVTPPAYEEVELSPVVLRSVGREEGREQVEMLVSANALNLLMPAVGVANGLVFLKKARAIVCGERVFTVIEVSAERFAGVVYLYRVKASC